MTRRGAARLAALLAPMMLCGACSLTVPASVPPFPAAVLDQKFTPQELAADVDELLAFIEEVHPDPYATLSREEVRARRDALVASFDRPLLRRELQPRLAELVAALGDGHTTVYVPQEEFQRSLAGPQGCFPIDVVWDGASVLVRRTAVAAEDGALAPGARILEISGRPAPELFRTFLARQSGETEAWRASNVEESFAVRLWLEGLQPPYHVRFAAAGDGHQFTVDVPGMAFDAVARGPAPTGVVVRFILGRRADGVAVVTIDTFANDLGDFEDWMEEVFGSFAKDRPAALVIDLRANGGGDSRLGDELLQYVTDRPWRQHARKEWKVSEPMKRQLEGMLPAWIRWLPVQYLHPTGWAIWTADDGDLAVFDYDYERPRDEPLRYTGPVGWLIGPSTFSSASSLAAAVKDCGLGLLVGSGTGGVVSGFGEVIVFQLSRTKLAGQVSSARFVRPNGRTDERGSVPPDLEVRPAPSAPGDPVLEAAVAVLRAQRAAAAPASGNAP